MHSLSRVSVRGQVAIPKKIREYLKIKEGDMIIFEVKDGEVRIRKISKFLDQKGTLKKRVLKASEVRRKAEEGITEGAL